MSVAEDSLTQLAFFEYLFSHDEGYISIATTRPPARRDTFSEKFFEWPAEKDKMLKYIGQVTPSHNVYFGVNVLSVARRIKENAIPQNLVWADLDACRPDTLDIPPQCVIESSPGHYQAIWRLERKIDPRLAENYSKRIAYYYADLGVDKSGHDLTQLLRVPGTYNFKYQMQEVPTVRLVASVDDIIAVDFFEALPPPDGRDDVPDLEVPKMEQLPDPQAIIYRYQDDLRATAFARYFSEEPHHDWSKAQWRLINTCFDVGMSKEETFVIAYHAKCNKYERDGRPVSHLWREVLKAEADHKSIDVLLSEYEQLRIPELLTQKEIDRLKPTIVDDYMSWATEVTDAVSEFHEVCCCMLMSALMSTTLRMQLKHSAVVPNLWSLILGESTLTRKTTAMDMAMDYIFEIDRDLMLASDASAEGLMSALSLRPRMVSIFYRDEVTGFFEAMNKKDWMANLQETMTKLYDVPKYLARKLKKDTYAVSEPIFIFFGGGVPDKMYSLINESYFTSGFMPRFLVMRGYGSVENVRPTGPPVHVETNKRADLLSTFHAFHQTYTAQEISIELPTGEKILQTPEIYVSFDEKVWARAAQMESALLTAANESSESPKALPMFSRMYMSMLKMAMLFAAARQEPVDNHVKGEMRDLFSAAHYIQKWGRDAVDLIQNSGTTHNETQLRAIYRTIEHHPGILRGQIMQRHHMSAFDMEKIETTLIQRMMLQVTPKGGGKQYWPIGR